jgi:predicted CopG family antitoxin
MSLKDPKDDESFGEQVRRLIEQDREILDAVDN